MLSYKRTMTRTVEDRSAWLSTEARQAAFLTIGVWVLWLVLYILPEQMFTRALRPSTAVMLVVVAISGMLLSGVVFEAARRLQVADPAAKVLGVAAVAIAASVGLALIDGATSGVVIRLLGETPRIEADERFVRNAAAFVWKFATLGAVYAVLESNRAGRERDRLLAEAQRAAGEAKLAALRYQLNPHFLFNTLNAISSLVVTRRVEEGEAMLARLSDFLRASLATDAQGQSTVEDELAMLQHYLEIEAVRFRNRLEIDFVCPPDLHDALVPSFVLQPLIENAIKYAVAPTRRQVTIRVEVARDETDLVIVVEDDGDPEKAMAVARGTGLGLANVRQRLEVLHGARGSLETLRRERGFLAVVRLPLQRSVGVLRRVA